jgi:hypothetical protein
VENNVCEKGRRQEKYIVFQCEVEKWGMVWVCVCVRARLQAALKAASPAECPVGHHQLGHLGR